MSDVEFKTHVTGDFMITDNRVTVDLRTGVYAAARVDMTIETDADINRAIDTACQGLAARLRYEYQAERRREIERRGRISKTVETIAGERS